MKISFKTLQAFYRWKSMLTPEFYQKNKRAINLIESQLIKAMESNFNQSQA